jgi:hypothetical protein
LESASKRECLTKLGFFRSLNKISQGDSKFFSFSVKLEIRKQLLDFRSASDAKILFVVLKERVDADHRAGAELGG